MRSVSDAARARPLGGAPPPPYQRRGRRRCQSVPLRHLASMAAPAHDDSPGPHSVSAMQWCGCEACGPGCDEAGAARDAAPGGDQLWRVALAECAGTALLVLLTCAATCAPSAAASPLQRSIASGFVVALLVQCLAHVSGAQLNPTVTLAALLWGRMSRRRALCEALAQLAGAALGAAALRALLGGRVAGACATVPDIHIGPFQASTIDPPEGGDRFKAVLHTQAVALEAVLGGCLALANCAAWDARAAALQDSWPLRVGVSVAAMSLVAVSSRDLSLLAAALVLDAGTQGVLCVAGRADRRQHEPGAELRPGAVEFHLD
ncbi:hypothetical protein HF086_017537 [Spodoptera exigua]|uniref:Uncharacterized protein n=1 Tax=Spodoptera exigua TaxID=7107 RepID=A0A922STW7_SPOEX|nr:hypothetical protein HF086_017537 [Spodoptera exigua]